MSVVPCPCLLGTREQQHHQLYLQRGVHGARRLGVRGVRGGDIQGCEWLERVRAVPAG